MLHLRPVHLHMHNTQLHTHLHMHLRTHLHTHTRLHAHLQGRAEPARANQSEPINQSQSARASQPEPTRASHTRICTRTCARTSARTCALTCTHAPAHTQACTCTCTRCTPVHNGGPRRAARVWFQGCIGFAGADPCCPHGPHRRSANEKHPNALPQFRIVGLLHQDPRARQQHQGHQASSSLTWRSWAASYGSGFSKRPCSPPKSFQGGKHPPSSPPPQYAAARQN